MAPRKSPDKIIAEQSVLVPIDQVKPYRKNPRVGDVGAIAESLQQNGQFRPIVVSKGTGEILAGNHTWKAAKSLEWDNIQVVYVDVDDTAAKRIVLADNRTNDLSTYSSEVLAEILDSLPTPVGTGYDDKAVRSILAGIQDRDSTLVTEVIRPPVRVEFEGADEDEWDLSSHIAEQRERHDRKFGDVGNGDVAQIGLGTDVEKMRVAESIASIQYQLEQIEGKTWDSSNYWGVPDLRSDMLCDTLPDPLDTWGGQDATPDDGKTTWIWNYGVAASKGLPYDRAILSFFTYDTKFDSWFDEPAFKTAEAIHNGITRAIVPDTSFWNGDPRYLHLSAAYKSMWMARFMQEAGIKIIPRFMWCDLESVKVGVLGIPKNPPIAAVCIQAIDKKEAAAQMTAEGLRAFVKEIKPDALVVYGSGTARKVTEDAILPKELHVVHVENYAAKRRGVVFDNATGKQAVEKAQRRAMREARAAGNEATARQNDAAADEE